MCARISRFSVVVREDAAALPDDPCDFLQFRHIWTQCAVMFPHGEVALLHEIVAQDFIP